MQFECCGEISKITQISKFMTIRAVGAELFRADGRTDRQIGRIYWSLFGILRMCVKIPAIYLNRTRSADSIWICTVQHEVPVLKLTAFS